jgi:uridine phosphorylase
VYESDWLDVVGLKADEVPEIIVLEGSWWRSNREKERLPHLSAVRELAAPDWWLGEYHDRRVLYACLYGAARAIEPIGILGPFGVRVAVQIGSCGGLAHVTNTGEYIVPTTVTPEDGVSRGAGRSRARGRTYRASRSARLGGVSGLGSTRAGLDQEMG